MSNRYKPRGWRGESYRHYLAAKGITSKRYHASTYAGTALERAFKKGDVQRQQVATAGAEPVARRLVVERAAARRELSPDEKEAVERLRQQVSGRGGSLLELAEAWNPQIGLLFKNDAETEVNYLKDELKDIDDEIVSNPTKVKELGARREALDDKLKIANEKLKSAKKVLENNKKGALDTATRSAMGKQVQTLKQQEQMFEEGF